MRPLEPPSGAEEPVGEDEDDYTAHRNRGVVQRLGVHRVSHRQAEEDGDDAGPCDCHPAHGEAHPPGS